ncbi:MAG: glycosyltransferase [bacterium]|nr:glycosyltransferase [bacterium]
MGPFPLGIVAIGRNEGVRLERCLRTALKAGAPMVYVDSVSSDGSAERARRHGVDVIELDPEKPLSAARGRNAGFRLLLEQMPDLELVQFIDGDCELVDGWLSEAVDRLDQDSELGAVCGRRRELSPAESIYNRLIDLEWDTPVGRTSVFGGDVLIRAAIFRDVEGYDETLIAGEDPDLAARISAAGWKIERLDVDMTVHDAGLSRFRQWWMRQIRAGHAVADAWLRSSWSDSTILRRLASILFWGAAFPLGILAWVVAIGGATPLGLLLAYPVLGLRIYLRMRKRGRAPVDAALYAGACIEGKFAEVYGAAQCLLNRVRRGPQKLIEYK